MKKLLIFAIIVLSFVGVYAQAPQKLSYQAIIRNAANAIVANSTVGMRVSILQGTAAGPSVYVETQTPATNANGLATIVIGNGTLVSGNFTTISWGGDIYFIKTETDPTGGTNYTITGTAQILSAPYALYANTAGTAAPTGAAGGNFTGTYPNPTIANNAVTNAKISSGAATNGNVLTADGSGNSSWQSAGGGNSVGFSANLASGPSMNFSQPIMFWITTTPYYANVYFNATTGIYTVPEAGTYSVSAVVNYSLTTAVTSNVYVVPAFEIRLVSPQITLAKGVMPILDINMALPLSTLAITTPLRTATITVTKNLVLAAGQEIALYYVHNGFTQAVALDNTSFTVKKL